MTRPTPITWAGYRCCLHGGPKTHCQTWTDFNNLWYTKSWGNDTPEGCKFVHLTWNMSLHYLVKCRTSIHWLFVTGILLRNFVFKQLRCKLKISKSMDFYCFLNFFTPKLYRFPHKKMNPTLCSENLSNSACERSRRLDRFASVSCCARFCFRHFRDVISWKQ